MKKKLPVDPNLLMKRQHQKEISQVKHNLRRTEWHANHLDNMLHEIEMRFGIEITEDFSRPEMGNACISFDKAMLRTLNEEQLEKFFRATGERLARYAIEQLKGGR